MKRGYIKLFRDIMDHWLWQDKPFSKGQAWIDLMMMANHESKKIVFGKEIILVERGSFITSEVKLMERWGWSKSKVRDFLDIIEKDEMIVKKSDRKKTTITLCNYKDWQNPETTEEPTKDQQKTSEGLLTDTNKNDKNIYPLYSIYNKGFVPVDNLVPVDNEENMHNIIDEIETDAQKKFREIREKLLGKE